MLFFFAVLKHKQSCASRRSFSIPSFLLTLSINYQKKTYCSLLKCSAKFQKIKKFCAAMVAVKVGKSEEVAKSFI